MRKELIILSGFLGSGKTTLLRSLLLRHSDRKIAVLLNDFGDIPVDGETLRRSGVEGGVSGGDGGGSGILARACGSRSSRRWPTSPPATRI